MGENSGDFFGAVCLVDQPAKEHQIATRQRKSFDYFVIQHLHRQRCHKVHFCGQAVLDILKGRKAIGLIACRKAHESPFVHGHADLFKLASPVLFRQQMAGIPPVDPL